MGLLEKILRDLVEVSFNDKWAKLTLDLYTEELDTGISQA